MSRQEDPWGYADSSKEHQKSGVRPSRWFVGLGPVAVLGVASWSPAVGVALSGGVRVNEYVSVSADGRAAWLTSGVAGKPISAMTAGGLLSACGHVRWFFGCLTGHLGVIHIEPARDTFDGEAFTFVRPGLGGRVGARIGITESFALQFAADAVGSPRGLRIGIGRTTLAEIPPVMVGGGFSGVWEF